jgi:hypothetical protein
MAIRRHKVGCLADIVALRVVEICTLYQGLGLEQLSDRRGAEEGQAKLAALAISMRQIPPCSILYRHAVWLAHILAITHCTLCTYVRKNLG